LIQKYLENSLNAEVLPIPGRVITVEIRKAVTQDEVENALKQVGGKVIPPFKIGVSAETRDLTKKILEDKLNTAGFKEIPIRTVGDNYILIDLAAWTERPQPILQPNLENSRYGYRSRK